MSKKKNKKNVPFVGSNLRQGRLQRLQTAVSQHFAALQCTLISKTNRISQLNRCERRELQVYHTGQSIEQKQVT